MFDFNNKYLYQKFTTRIIVFMIKTRKTSLWLVLSIILILVSGFVRLYNFQDRLNFGPEQAISLITSANYIHEKFTLLGQPDLIRNTSLGFVVFQGAWFNYSLVPLQLAFNYDPVAITAFFALLNIFTGVTMLYLMKRRFGWAIALLSTTFFLFYDRVIAHSLFIWILNYLPLIGVLLLYLLTDKKKYFTPLSIFLIGLLIGAAFSLEYAFIFTALAIFVYTLYRSENKIVSVALFIFGAAIFNLPMLIFDIKHNFFHIFVFWQYAHDIFGGKTNAGWTYYHFMHFWPALCALVSFLLINHLRQTYYIGLILLVYILFNLSSGYVSFNKAIGMPYGLKYQDVYTAAELITQNDKNNFSVASLIDFDTRSHPLRYLLKYVFGQNPLGLDNYEEASELFVFTPDKETYDKSQAFELESFRLLPIETISTFSGRYQLYKISK